MSVVEQQTMENNIDTVDVVAAVDDDAASVATSGESMYDDDASFQGITLLLDHGITQAEIIKFQNAGVNTIKGVQMMMRKEMFALGFNDAKIQRIQEACAQLTVTCGFVTAVQLAVERKQIFRVSTGSNALNNLLGGGIEAKSITEVFGEFAAGKTQLAHTLCVTAQLPGPNGYMGGKVIFIDTEHTFRPDRLRPIAERFCMDQTNVMENVLYARAFNSEHQFDLLNAVAAKMHQEPGLFKLLIVDSIMALFRVDYSGMSEMATRQKKLGQMLSRLQKLSEEYNIAVFLTNQITSDFTQLRDESKPVGGHVLAHSSTTRLAFKKGVGNRRYACLLSCPELEAVETKFMISAGGIIDASD